MCTCNLDTAEAEQQPEDQTSQQGDRYSWREPPSHQGQQPGIDNRAGGGMAARIAEAGSSALADHDEDQHLQHCHRTEGTKNGEAPSEGFAPPSKGRQGQRHHSDQRQQQAEVREIRKEEHPLA
ncbi:hypothetical protein [Dankookia sp. P2]|uniref:hypothetical protein n=1 Tax=Dankookia sp. P2 TaxID=3423955 RepID=UPI003D678CA1